MSYAPTGHGDGANITSTTTPTYTGFTVAAGEAVSIVVVSGNAETTTAVNDGTNAYTLVGTIASDTSDGFKFSWWYNPNVAAVTAGTLTVTQNSAGSNNAAIWTRGTGLDSAAAAQAGPGYARTASTVSGTDNCSAASISASSQPAILMSIGIDLQGATLSAGTGFTDDGNFTNLPSSGFGWQGRIEHQQITDLSPHTATTSSATTAHTVIMLAAVFTLAGGGGISAAWFTA